MGFDEKDTLQFIASNEDESQTLDWLEQLAFKASQIQRMLNYVIQQGKSIDISDEMRQGLWNPTSSATSYHDIFNQIERTWPELYPLIQSFHIWEQEGMAEEWKELLEMVCTLDSSTLLMIDRFDALFDSSKNYVTIKANLREALKGEQDQHSQLDDFFDALRTKGYSIDKEPDASLIDRYKKLEQWEHFDAVKDKLNGDIVQLIRPFDPELSRLYTTQAISLTTLDHLPEINTLHQQVCSSHEIFEQRLHEIELEIHQWKMEGIRFPHEGHLLPEDLLEWDTNLNAIRQRVEHQKSLREVWRRFERVWPSRVENSRHLVGKIELNDELQLALDVLDSQWKEYELDAIALVEQYEQHGLILEHWKDAIREDPANAIDLMQTTKQHWDQRIDLLNQYQKLDCSTLSQDDILARIQMLREIELSREELDVLHSLLSQLERRNTRHRMMLEDEIKMLRRNGSSFVERPTHTMSLAEFERYLVEASSGLFGSQPKSIERMKLHLANEISILKQQGWNVLELEALTERSLDDAVLALHNAQPHLQAYQHLSQRIKQLPWQRDVSKALEIEIMLKQPTMLGSLASQIPTFAKQLATRPIEDEQFELSVWKPLTIHVVGNIDSVGSSFDDANEAILEAMDEQVSALDLEHGREILPLITERSSPNNFDDGPDEELKPSFSINESINQGGIQINTTVEEVAVEEENSMPSDDERSRFTDSQRDLAQSQKTPKPNVEQQSSSVEGEIGHTQSLHRAWFQFLMAVNLDRLASQFDIEPVETIPMIRRKLAKIATTSPMDMRVSRLVRIAMRCLPNDESNQEKAAILNVLTTYLQPLKKWTRLRLESRHSGAKGSFFDDVGALSKALERIPGPGKPISLEVDNWPLPSDFSLLMKEATSLGEVVMLPSAGGIITS